MFQSHHWWEIFWGAVLGLAMLGLGLWLGRTRDGGESVSRIEADLRARLEVRERELSQERERAAERADELERLRRELAPKEFSIAAAAPGVIAEAPVVLVDESPVPAGADELVGDDLEQIHGVGPKLARRLRENGVTTFAQIAAWTDADIDGFDARLPEFKGRIRKERWVASARECLERALGGDAPEQEEVVAVAAVEAKPAVLDEADDLVDLYGVGPRIARLLNEHGVTRFRQIAVWTPADVQRFSALLPDFKDRIRHEGWIESAREEHFKKYGERI